MEYIKMLYESKKKISQAVTQRSAKWRCHKWKEFDGKDHGLVVLDDLIHEIGSSKEMANIFVRHVHHKNLSVIMLCQNIFHQARYMRSISLNIHYLALMRTFRDRDQIMKLARQTFANDWRRMVEAYNDCITFQKRGYLLVCNYPSIEEDERLVTNIFPEENLTVYLPL